MSIKSAKKVPKEYWPLIILFLITFLLRLYLSFTTPNFSDDQTYFVMNQAAHITDTGFPAYEDSLSYSGREYIFLPLYHYLTAFFSVLLPIGIVSKILPNLIICLIIFVVYGISHELTKNKKAALTASLFSSFIPVLFSQTINSSLPLFLTVLLSFFLLYCFMKIKNGRKYAYYYIIGLIALTLTHPISGLLAVSLLLYTAIVKSENLKQEKSEIELIIFTTFFVLWINFMVYKKALLQYGPIILWQNIPQPLLNLNFSDFTALESLNLIGLLPLILGIYIIYKYAFKEKLRHTYIFVSFSLVIFLLLWIQLIRLTTGLIFLSIILVILSSQAVKLILLYIEKSRFPKFQNPAILLIIIIFIITSIIPSFYFADNNLKKSFSEEEISAFNWMHENLPPDVVIAASPYEGHLITTISKRKNIMDSNFLLIQNVEQRYEDIIKIFTPVSETRAIELLNKYNADYIYLSERTKKFFSIDELNYVENENCFKLIYDNNIKIYRSLCTLEEIG